MHGAIKFLKVYLRTHLKVIMLIVNTSIFYSNYLTNFSFLFNHNLDFVEDSWVSSNPIVNPFTNNTAGIFYTNNIFLNLKC